MQIAVRSAFKFRVDFEVVYVALAENILEVLAAATPSAVNGSVYISKTGSVPYGTPDFLVGRAEEI